MTGSAPPRPTRGFAAIAGPDIHTLVLGTLPSRRSIETGRYYGHPRNAFWPIMGRLFGAGPELAYQDRKARLVAAGIGVWDVLESSPRQGSLDAAIEVAHAVPNDLCGFIARHRALARLAFNGKTAERLFRRLSLPLPPERRLDYLALPSTSPAHAAMSFEEKLRRWAVVASGNEA